MADEQRLVNVWEDTVDLRQLLIGLACGSALGFASYAGAIRALTVTFPDQTASLIKAYALMAGIAGCIVAAILVAVIVKPKRVLCETEQGLRDQAALLQELALNLDDERRALEGASPQLIREMQQLQVYDLFTESSQAGPQ